MNGLTSSLREGLHRNPSNASCVACTHDRLDYFGRRDRYAYYRCESCGTLQLSPMPDAAAMADAYKNDYAGSGHCQERPEVRNQAAIPQFEAIVAALSRHAHPSLVLDYGPGWGGLLLALRARGIAAEGAELSQDMADYCTRQGFTIHRCGLDDIPGQDRYDAILLSSVFEHLVDHEGWLQDARRLLKPGGLVVSLQPTAPFASFVGTVVRLGVRRIQLPQLHQVFWPPWHTTLFSIAGMGALAERGGFELLEVSPAPLQREGGVTGLIQRSVSLVNAAATPVFGLRWPLWPGHVFVLRLPDHPSPL